ncbi:MAG: c-type cytochrome [Vicinamibacterales bacterium]
MRVGPSLAVLALASLTLAGANSAASQPVASRPSVWDGVYTPDQAARGQQVYDTACSACHGRDLKGIRDNRPLVGDRFWQDWGEDSLGTLLSVVQRTMPRNAPGSLPEQDYLDIVAYVLQQNGYPAGNRDLTTSTATDVWVMKKEGPGPVPNFSMVWVVACLTKDPDNTWVMAKTSEPVKTRNPAPSEGAELERVTQSALGTETYGLLDLPSKYAGFSGRRVEAKGLLIRGPRNKLNLTSMQAIPGDCPP